MRRTPSPPRSRSCGPIISTPELAADLLHRGFEVGHDESDLKVCVFHVSRLPRRSTLVARAYSAVNGGVNPSERRDRWRRQARRGSTVVDHVGLTVTDLDAAIAWYVAVFGLEVLQGPDVIGGDEERVRDIFGPEVADFRIAYLGSGTGPRLQLFEFTSRRSSAARRASSTGAPASPTSGSGVPTSRRRSPGSRRTAAGAGARSTVRCPARCTATARTRTGT